MPTRYFYDTEFIDDGKTIELLSIGIVSESGDELYAVVNDLELMTRAGHHPWLRDNVVAHLPVRLDEVTGAARWDDSHPDRVNVLPRGVIADEVRDFLLSDGDPELWAWFAAYDHVVLSQLWGKMIDLPRGVPMLTHELVQRWEDAGRPPRPTMPSDQHNALADARWNRRLWLSCRGDSWSKGT